MTALCLSTARHCTSDTLTTALALIGCFFRPELICSCKFHVLQDEPVAHMHFVDLFAALSRFCFEKSTTPTDNHACGDAFSSFVVISQSHHLRWIGELAMCESFFLHLIVMPLWWLVFFTWLVSQNSVWLPAHKVLEWVFVVFFDLESTLRGNLKKNHGKQSAPQRIKTKQCMTKEHHAKICAKWLQNNQCWRRKNLKCESDSDQNSTVCDVQKSVKQHWAEELFQ